MNHFFALELPPKIGQPLAEYARRWREKLGNERFRWYDPSDYHITLKFLGDVQTADEERFVTAAMAVSRQCEPFSIELAGPSALPNPERFANVLTNGIYPSGGLSLLVKELELALSLEGFAKEKRPYLPHVTFARCKKREQDIQFPKFEHVFLQCSIDHFVLMQTLPPESRANGAKARYNLVHTFPFGNPQPDVS